LKIWFFFIIVLKKIPKKKNFFFTLRIFSDTLSIFILHFFLCTAKAWAKPSAKQYALRSTGALPPTLPGHSPFFCRGGAQAKKSGAEQKEVQGKELRRHSKKCRAAGMNNLF
jgi:hypothetical protein